MSDLNSPQRPLVSVIIVNYNGGRYLLETVRSAFASTVPIEVFVVDNGSIDDSVWQLERAYVGEPRLHIIENAANLGFARANNIALEQASGKFLLLLNPDCIVMEDTLERMVEALRNDPRAGMAGCLIRNPDGSEQAGCRRSLPTPWNSLVRVLHLDRLLGRRRHLGQVDMLHNPLPEQPVYVEAISGAFMLVRREAMNHAGVMDDSYFLHCEDLDWCKTFQDAGWKILFVPGVEIIHHKGACSAKKPVFVLWHKHRGMVRFYRKFLSRQYSMPFNLFVILGVWARFSVLAPAEFIGNIFRRESPAAELDSFSPKDVRPVPDLPQLPHLRGQSVLVTGGTGFIGRRLVRELLRQGAKVRVLTRSPERIEEHWREGDVSFVTGDLECPDSIRDVCEGVATLFHLASCAHVLDTSASAGDGGRHQRVTKQGTHVLLQEAERSRVGCFVFVSSVKAMGEEDEHCLDEFCEPAPETSYGRAKLHAEREVMESGRRCGMRTTVLRLPMVYGPGIKGNLPRMIEAIRKSRFPPLPEVHNRRAMVHVDDTVQAMLLAAVKEQADRQVYIVTDGHVYSTRQIYAMIAANLGKRLPPWTVPLWGVKLAARIGDMLLRAGVSVPLDSTVLRKLLGSAWYRADKIRDELGFLPRYDLQQALPDIVADQGRLPTVSADRLPEHSALGS